jgi:phenylacetate-CoA ligase
MPNEPTRSYPSSAWNALLRLSRAQILAQQNAQLRKLLYVAAQCNPFYQRKLAGIDLDAPGPDVLARLPFTTRAELHEDQLAHPPYGSNLSRPVADYRRLHQTSGTGRDRFEPYGGCASWSS